MVDWESLIRFLGGDGREYWAAVPLNANPAIGLTVQGFSSVRELESGRTGVKVDVEKARYLWEAGKYQKHQQCSQTDR